MALLVGLMLGSLRKVAVPQRAGGRRYECAWPQEFNGEVWLSLGTDCVGSVLVLALERLSRRR